MEPRDNTGANGPRRNEGHLSGEVLHDIRTPLSVIYGHVQLLQRRLRQGETLENDQLLQKLNYIEQAARSIEAHLRARNDEARRPTDGAEDQ